MAIASEKPVLAQEQHRVAPETQEPQEHSRSVKAGSRSAPETA